MTNKTITLARETLENSLKDGSSDPVVYASYRKAVADIRAALAEPTIGIDHETMRARYTDPEAVGLSSGTGSTLRVVAADHVPPADEEPEVLQAVEDAMWGCFRDGVKEYRGCTRERVEETRSLIRAHVTRLQAEVERLKAACSKEFESVEALSHELTKARELFVKLLPLHGYSSGLIVEVNDWMRANQSALSDSQEIQKDRIKGMIATVGGEFAIMIDPANAHFGWTFKKHPDGMWVSGRIATEVEMYAARQYAKSTGQGV